MNRFLKSPWAVPEVIPLVVPIIGGISFAGFMGYKHFRYNQDVVVLPSTKRSVNLDDPKNPHYMSKEESTYKKFVDNNRTTKNPND